MTTLTSSGKCFFCDAEFAKAGITRHLNNHLAKQATLLEPGTSFHIKIENDPYAGGSLYFLNLWVDGDTPMYEIDDFLRAIWLECCGHLSAFTDPQKEKLFSIFEDDSDEIMDSETKDILKKGMKLKYQYDFGSTTKLLLTVIEQYNVKVPDEIVLLSRNEPLQIMCEICGTEPAAMLCNVCYDPNMFCKKCAKKHAKTCDDFAEYSALPIINSPRMGVCAYDGGTIDKKRDGAYKKK